MGGWGDGGGVSERQLKGGCFSIFSLEEPVVGASVVCARCLSKRDALAADRERCLCIDHLRGRRGGPAGGGASSEACDIDCRNCETNGRHQIPQPYVHTHTRAHVFPFIFLIVQPADSNLSNIQNLDSDLDLQLTSKTQVSTWTLDGKGCWNTWQPASFLI